MKSRNLLIAVLLFGTASYIGISCSRDSKSPAITNIVNIQSSTFDPGTITIVKGSTITWKNNDGFDHTATSNTGVSPAFNTGTLAGGASSTPIPFNSTGTFPYHCLVHGLMMSGIVVVTN